MHVHTIELSLYNITAIIWLDCKERGKERGGEREGEGRREGGGEAEEDKWTLCLLLSYM